MTVYVAHCAPGGRITIGSDSRFVHDFTPFDYGEKIAFNKDRTRAVALAGAGRIDTLIERLGDKFWSAATDAHEIIARFTELIRSDGWKAAESEGDPNEYDIEGLIVSGGLWIFDGSLALSRVPTGRFVASGGGSSLAMGAIHAARALGATDPRRLVRMGIEAAIAHNTGCGAPVRIHQIDPAPLKRKTRGKR